MYISKTFDSNVQRLIKFVHNVLITQLGYTLFTLIAEWQHLVPQYAFNVSLCQAPL